jgi:hypothetical protein
MPFTSYRPKIPIEHSLAGEEYLRRWLLVETLAHYEDSGILLQRLENCARNAIEDEEQLTFDSLFPTFFLPFYVELSEVQAHHVKVLSSELDVMMQKCDAQRNAAYLDVIMDEEARMRALMLQSEADATQLIRSTMAHMETVTFAAGKAQRLQEELVRQRRRHNGEMYALTMQVRDTTQLASCDLNRSGDFAVAAVPWIPSPPNSRKEKLRITIS